MPGAEDPPRVLLKENNMIQRIAVICRAKEKRCEFVSLLEKRYPTAHIYGYASIQSFCDACMTVDRVYIENYPATRESLRKLNSGIAFQRYLRRSIFTFSEYQKDLVYEKEWWMILKHPDNPEGE